MKAIIIASTILISFSFSTNAQKPDKHPLLVESDQIALEKAKVEKPIEINSSSVSTKTSETPKQTTPYKRPDKKERFDRYVRNTVGLRRIGTNVAKAGLFTLTNTPEEWEKTGEGFARRFASEMGETAIRQTTIYGLDEALKVDSRFYKSQKRDFGSKVKNALLSTVTARNKNGKRVVGIPKITGTYASQIISREAWYPDRFNYKDGLRGGSISLGFDAVINLFREVF